MYSTGRCFEGTINHSRLPAPYVKVAVCLPTNHFLVVRRAKHDVPCNTNERYYFRQAGAQMNRILRKVLGLQRIKAGQEYSASPREVETKVIMSDVNRT